MRYLIENADGTVAVMIMVPLAVEINGARHAIFRTEGQIMHLSDGQRLDAGLPIDELMPDSIPGVTLRFANPIDECAKSGGKPSRCVPIAKADLPTDRTFRNAWCLSNHKCEVDMPKARDIWREKMRQVRGSKLSSLDVAYQRADEKGQGAEKTRIAALKQTLRDVTNDPGIDAALTPGDLKAVWPDCLK